MGNSGGFPSEREPFAWKRSISRSSLQHRSVVVVVSAPKSGIVVEYDPLQGGTHLDLRSLTSHSARMVEPIWPKISAIVVNGLAQIRRKFDWNQPQENWFIRVSLSVTTNKIMDSFS